MFACLVSILCLFVVVGRAAFKLGAARVLFCECIPSFFPPSAYLFCAVSPPPRSCGGMACRYLDYEGPSSQQASTTTTTGAPPISTGGPAPALEAGAESAARPAGTVMVMAQPADQTAAAAGDGEGRGEEVVEEEEEEQNRGRPSTRLGRVVAGWVGLLPDAARSWGRFEQFLEVIEGVGNMGDRERDLLLNRRMVCRLGSFFLQVGWGLQAGRQAGGQASGIGCWTQQQLEVSVVLGFFLFFRGGAEGGC